MAKETRLGLISSGQVTIIRTPAEIWGENSPRVPRNTYRRGPKPETAPDWLSIQPIASMTAAQKDREMARWARRLPEPEYQSLECITA